MPQEVWLPLVTLILGYVGSLVTESRRDARLAKREETARREARERDRDDRRDAFQRTTLLELQEALFTLARLTGAMHTEDQRNFRESGQWAKGPYKPDLENEGQAANARLGILQVRVLDDQLRVRVDAFHDAATRAALGLTREGAIKSIEGMTTEFLAANARVGELLRSLY